nr:hypothetical protein [Sedimentibacter sp.]
MTKKSVSIKKILRFAGAFVAFLIGSGFATGQEIIQYFVSYGYMGLVGIIVMFSIFLYMGVTFILFGYEHRNLNQYDIYTYYCGMTIGRFYNYFTIVFAYMSVIVMIGGAGATLNQQFGLPIYAGCIIMAVLSGITVILGLNKIVDIIGKIGPVIAMLSILLGLLAIIKNPMGLITAEKIIPNLKLMKASTNWFFAACTYVGFSILWLATFLSSMGATANSKKEAALGAITGVTFFSLAVMAVSLGLLANIELVAGSMIPSLILAENIKKVFAHIFSIAVVAGIYTTSVPLLWTVSSRISNEQSCTFIITTVVLTIVATLIGLNIPFDLLINLVYGINGYIGMVFLIFVITKKIINKYK